MIFTPTSAYAGMHASVFHTLVSKYGNCFCSSCTQQMGAKNENIHTTSTNSCLFCLSLCISEGKSEELKKKGRRGKSQRNLKVHMGNGLWLQLWYCNTERRRMPSGGRILHGCRTLTLARITGSHLNVAISVPSKHRCVAFSILFHFLSASILFSRVLHVPALYTTTAGLCLFSHA